MQDVECERLADDNWRGVMVWQTSYRPRFCSHTFAATTAKATDVCPTRGQHALSRVRQPLRVERRRA